MKNTNTDVCAVELARRINEHSKVFPSSKGAFMQISYLVSKDTYDRFIFEAEASGFSAVSTDCDTKHVFTVYESKREVLYVLYMTSTEELRLIWEKKRDLRSYAEDGCGKVEIMQIGIGNYGDHGDNPMVGMAYIVKLANSHALLIDGGFDNEGYADNIYRGMEKFGIAKDGDKFIIDAWYITHLDGDHVGILKGFFAKYSEKAIIHSFVQNFPVGDPAVINGAYAPVGNDYISLMERTYPEAEVITAHPSSVFEYSGAKIKILSTAELHYSVFAKLMDGNDASLVFMLETEGARALFMGDAGEISSRSMYCAYGKESLKCDVFQIPHHGLTTGYSVFTRPFCEHAYLSKIYEATEAEINLLPMGETFNSVGNHAYGNNQRKAVFEGYPQNAYFLGSKEDNFGYDGKNIITKTMSDGRIMTTYLMSTDTEPMITVIGFSEGKAKMLLNETLADFFA